MTLDVCEYQGDGREWDAFVHRCDEATSYHRYAWRGVVERSFGHGARYLAARAEGGAIAGVLPLVHMKSALFGNFLVSVPFFNYGGPLTANPAASELLVAQAQRLMEGVGASHVELRHLGRKEVPSSRDHKVTMLLDLAETETEQWERFNAKLRNQVRKALKSGLTFAMGGSELLEPFYRVFARNMRDLGTPVYGRRFFEAVLASFPDTTRVMTVASGGTVIAAGIASWFRDTLEVPWASSIRDYKALCPNNLLYWEAIRFAIAGGFRTFDFGRSTLGEGTYRFKEQWGARPVPLTWQYLLREGEELPNLSPANAKYRIAIRAWQQLPLAVSNLLGPQIVRNIP